MSDSFVPQSGVPQFDGVPSVHLSWRAKLHMRAQKLERLDRRWSLRLALPKDAHAQAPVQYWLTRVATHLGDSWVWWALAFILWRRNPPRHGLFGWQAIPNPFAERAAEDMWAFSRERTRVAGWWSTLLIVTGLVMAVKHLVQRPRPGSDTLLYGGGPDQHSFPSGHAARMGVVSIWAPLYGWGTGGVVGLIAFLVSWTRVRLGIHYVGDIVGGLLIGALIGLAGRYWYSKSGERFDP